MRRSTKVSRRRYSRESSQCRSGSGLSRLVLDVFEHVSGPSAHMLQVGLVARVGAYGGHLAGKPCPEIPVTRMCHSHARQMPLQFIHHRVQCFAVNVHAGVSSCLLAASVAALESALLQGAWCSSWLIAGPMFARRQSNPREEAASPHDHRASAKDYSQLACMEGSRHGFGQRIDHHRQVGHAMHAGLAVDGLQARPGAGVGDAQCFGGKPHVAMYA